MTASPSPAEPDLTGVPVRAAGRRAASRTDRTLLAERFLAVLPHLKRRIQAALPVDVREELDTVTPHQVEALHCVTREGGCAMNDLARAQGVGLSSATALADRLIRQGLAERVSDPTDRRIVRLVATDRARTLVERFAEAKRSSAVAMLDALDDDEAADLVRLVEKITSLGEEDEPVVRA